MIEGFSPAPRGADADLELFEDGGLADVLPEVPRAEGLVELLVPAAGLRFSRTHAALRQFSRPGPGAGSE